MGQAASDLQLMIEESQRELGKPPDEAETEGAGAFLDVHKMANVFTRHRLDVSIRPSD